MLLQGENLLLNIYIYLFIYHLSITLSDYIMKSFGIS